MRIGLNLVFLVPGETGGMEVYARQLVPELVRAAPEHRFVAFIGRDATGATPWLEGIETVVVPVHARNRVEWVRGEQQLLPISARRRNVDLLHSFASTAPAWGSFRRVVTIHDLIYRTMPEAHPGLRSLGMRVLVPLAARRSQRIIADSQATADDVARHIGITPERIDVVPLGVNAPHTAPMDESELRSRLQAGARPIVLSVSAKLAHKNLLRLLDALARFTPEQRPLLVLPGYATPHEQELRAHAAQLGIDPDVRFLGWVSAEELEGLYAAARVFAFPSLYEGFGLPVLEAMTRGVPVACSSRASLAEVAGDAALLFDPESADAIAQAIGRLLTDDALAERLRTAGRAQAARFSWAATAQGTLRAYRSALS